MCERIESYSLEKYAGQTMWFGLIFTCKDLDKIYAN
uniref:Uncharacterized protein n=1 Tax=Rhizophora mucronata TaxID=61149 RepID=A0A2P2R220_RHIMU